MTTISTTKPNWVSVIVCTYNRCRSLKRTLDCLAMQDVSANVDWEVIVVDNNSKDETADVVRDCIESKAIKHLRYELEAQQGLSYARNLGVSHARGEIIIFTDDDVCPESDWVEKIVESMGSTECDACGGFIAPDWEAAVPDWLTERFYGFLAVMTVIEGPKIVFEEKDFPFGANMAFRRAVFERIGLFDCHLGRKGSFLAGGEEHDIFRKLIADGGRIIYEPRARVYHHIESYRMKKRYFRRWRFQASYNEAAHHGIPGERRIFGIPLYLFPQLFKAILRAFTGNLHLSKDEAFFREMIVCHYLGYIFGLYQVYRSVTK